MSNSAAAERLTVTWQQLLADAVSDPADLLQRLLDPRLGGEAADA